jgi:tRNA-specific 2-thiouridylase
MNAMGKKKVVVAMSGGVDSSVAAALLKQEGYDLTGVSMQLLPEESSFEDARRCAELLKFSHRILDLRKPFQELVVSNFAHQYRTGRTPNPCIRCNAQIKFGLLLEEAIRNGADFIATGHYARIENDPQGKRDSNYLLKRGIDERKDQSYFLYTLTQLQLKHTLLPVGGRTKDEVREIAAHFGLSVSRRPESQEICFIAGNNYRTFFQRQGMAALPGTITDRTGKELGRHTGVAHYTIGQRRGLGIAGTEPYYVIRISPELNRIVVGRKPEAFFRTLAAVDVNWIVEPVKKPERVHAKIRSLHTASPAYLFPVGPKSVRLIFHTPQWAIAPGQAVVFYREDLVLGGGTIDHAE